MRVWVQSVQRAETGEIEVAEDVLRDQRWAEQQHEVGGENRHRQHSPGQRAHGEQYRQIARGHDQRERLEAVRGDAHAEARERARDPVRPAAATGGNVLRGPARRVRREQEDAREHADQPERAEHAQRARSDPRAGRLLYTAGRSPGDPNAGYGGCSLYGLIVTSTRRARVLHARYPVTAVASAGGPSGRGCAFESHHHTAGSSGEALPICDVATANPHTGCPGPAVS
jgi:hypothetical protein